MSLADATALARLAASALETDRLAPSVGVRAAALLGRQAIEVALDAILPECAEASMRARLLCLSHDFPARGGEASHLWSSLSRCCHQHAWEHEPSRTDVRRLVEQTGSWIAAA